MKPRWPVIVRPPESRASTFTSKRSGYADDASPASGTKAKEKRPAASATMVPEDTTAEPPPWPRHHQQNQGIQRSRLTT